MSLSDIQDYARGEWHLSTKEIDLGFPVYKPVVQPCMGLGPAINQRGSRECYEASPDRRSTNQMPTTPVSLLERLRHSGTAQDWERFVRLYTPLLWCWARRLQLENSESSDLIQDVFVLLHQKLPDFRYDRSQRFRGWLWTVFRNKHRERLRRQPPPGVPGNLDTLTNDDPITDLISREEHVWLVGRALGVMKSDFDEKTWRACWEFVVSGKPAEEVAAELGMTRNAVFLAKYRVLRRLREEFAGLLDDF